MSHRTLRTLALCMAALMTTGCGYAFTKTNVTAQGVRPMMITRDSFQKIDLARELYAASAGLEDKEEDKAVEKSNREILRMAFEAFYKEPFEQTQRRNRVQERLLAASNERCGEYKTFLKQIDSETNLILGSITTAVAGAGAIVTGAGAARALSGIAAILTGVRAEFNEDYFHNKTIQVITDGLEAKRKETYDKILDSRKLDLTGYPVEAAVKDALTYHAECSLITGLEHAALSIERARNPGLEGAEKALLQARRLQAIMDAKPSEFLPLGLPGLGGTTLGFAALDPLRGAAALGGAGPLETYAASRRLLAHLTEGFSKRIEMVKAEIKEKEKDKATKTDPKVFDPLEERGKAARDYADAVLRTQLGAAAAAHDAKLRAIEVEIVATVDVARRADKQLALADQLLQSTAVISEVNRVIMAFRAALGRAEAELADKGKPGPDARIQAADERLRHLLGDLVKRRADHAAKLVDEAGPNAPKIQQKLATLVQQEGQTGVVELLKAKQQDVEKNVGDKAKFDVALQKFDATFKQVADTIKEILAKEA